MNRRERELAVKAFSHSMKRYSTCHDPDCVFCNTSPGSFCTQCHGEGKTLTSECPREILKPAQEERIRRKTLDFVGGKWVEK